MHNFMLVQAKLTICKKIDFLLVHSIHAFITVEFVVLLIDGRVILKAL